MTNCDFQKIDIETLIASKMGNKSRYVPGILVKWLKKILHQDEVNYFLECHKDEEGVEWLRSSVEYLNLKLNVEGKENLPEVGGKYTFVCNHPLGGPDGIALGVILGEKYGNKMRYLLNDFLMFLPGLRPMGVPINKTGGQGRNVPKLVDEAFDSDNQIILFPAGLCSRRINGKVQDLEWKKTFVVKSIKTQRDIVPIHFSGENTKRFYRIANICSMLKLKFNIAMLFLADETFRHKHDSFDIRIGKPIPWQTFDKSKTPTDWAKYVRDRVYEL